MKDNSNNTYNNDTDGHGQISLFHIAEPEQFDGSHADANGQYIRIDPAVDEQSY